VATVSLLAGTSSAFSQTPVFLKDFYPETIGPGSVSILTFTIDNQSPGEVTDLRFEDILPTGIEIASPMNLSTDCNGTVSATAGENTISLTDGSIAASSPCGISVDVTSFLPGPYTNMSGDLLSSAGNSGSATADLTVSTDLPGFSKSFDPELITVGGRSTLTFTIDNTANDAERVSLKFSDSLPLGVVVADSANAATNINGGIITANSGTSLINFDPVVSGVDASVGAGKVVFVSVDVVGMSAGNYLNESGDLTSMDPQVLEEVSSGFANASLNVSEYPIFLTKTFTDDPVEPGGTTTLEFTFSNLDNDHSASDIAFTDDLSAVMEGLEATGLPMQGICGEGSILSGTSLITLSGGELEPETSCTFSVSVQIPTAASPGQYPNTTSFISAVINGNSEMGFFASDRLTVLPVPELTKEFVVNESMYVSKCLERVWKASIAPGIGSIFEKKSGI